MSCYIGAGTNFWEENIFIYNVKRDIWWWGKVKQVWRRRVGALLLFKDLICTLIPSNITSGEIWGSRDVKPKWRKRTLAWLSDASLYNVAGKSNIVKRISCSKSGAWFLTVRSSWKIVLESKWANTSLLCVNRGRVQELFTFYIRYIFNNSINKWGRERGEWVRFEIL